MLNLDQAIIGGGLIGIASALMLLFLGRITGISGILLQSMVAVGQRLSEKAPLESERWRFTFLIGMLIGAWFAHAVFGASLPTAVNQGYVLAGVAGLVVGVGTSLGSGCTSGHGVCGISRLSMRSVVATGVFMASAMITVFVFRHLI